MECVESVRVHPDNVTLRVGQWYYGASAEVSPASANCSVVEWHSDNPDIASVNASSGYIYGVSAGTTKIYAIAMDKNHCGDYITVTVVNNVPVTSVVLSRAEISIEEGYSFTLTATAFPENATNKALNWGSTNTSVATVCDGIVTAKSSGYAYIYAESAADSSIKSSCYVHVTDEVLVSSVTLNMSAMNMRVGESTFLEARVCPENAADRSLLWVSSNPEIATVISNSGLIFAHSPGQTTITAVPQDGSAAFDQCSLTVLPPIHVTGIGLEQTSLTMNVGDTATLDATVCPDDATDRRVTWRSSDGEVVSVDYYTGEITALSPGTTTITATTVDGEYAKTCTVRVIIERVTVQKDGLYDAVVFESSGKVWKCVNFDTINLDASADDYYGEPMMENNAYTRRAKMNYYTLYDPENNMAIDTTPKEYTHDELKLLYAIDPYGVIDYVNRYADYKYRTENRLKSNLEYKDEIFRVLFRKDPLYFKRNILGVWDETTDTDDLSQVLSESEIVFGMHVIWDAYAVLEILEVVTTIASIALGGPAGAFVEQIFDTVEDVLKIKETIAKAYAFTANTIENGFSSAISDALSEETFENTDISLSLALISMFNNLEEVFTYSNVGDNYYPLIMEYCVTELSYDINLAFESGENCSLKDIRDTLLNA